MRASGLLRSLAIVVVALLATATAVQAQITTGTVAGTVKDQQGGVIPGATVTLVNDAQGTKSNPQVTTSTGDFIFPNVAVGGYSVEVAMSGFKTLKRSGITLSAGERVQLGTLTIEIGGVQQTIEVKAETPLV